MEHQKLPRELEEPKSSEMTAVKTQLDFNCAK